MLSCIPEPSDVGIQQWLWSWLSAWQTLTTLLSNKLIGPGNYGSILPNTCTMPMPRWAHKLLFFTPRILLALWFLLFFPKYIERPESCLGSYLCLWQKNENSCCLGISRSSVLGVHIWIKEKCFVKEKNCYEWVETCYQCCTTPVKAELAPTDWLTEPEVPGVWTMPETLLYGSCDEARHFCLEGDNLSAPVFTNTAIWHSSKRLALWTSEYVGDEHADPEEGFPSLLLKRICFVLWDLGLECKLKPCNQTHAEVEFLRLKHQ